MSEVCIERKFSLSDCEVGHLNSFPWLFTYTIHIERRNCFCSGRHSFNICTRLRPRYSMTSSPSHRVSIIFSKILYPKQVTFDFCLYIFENWVLNGISCICTLISISLLVLSSTRYLLKLKLVALTLMGLSAIIV